MSGSKTFETPEAIAVTLSLNVADVRISAGERIDTVVTITPNYASRKADVEAAEQTRVEFAGGRLLVKAPRSWKQYTPFGGRESVHVSIELPTASSVEGEAWAGDLSCIGTLGECRYTTGAGEIRLERVGPTQVSTGAGRVSVDVAEGKSEITGSGQMRLGELNGPAVVKNHNGAIWIGLAADDLRCSSSNGDISIDRALGAVEARTANGDVRVGEVVRGTVAVKTAYGRLEIGIREGTAALLDVSSSFGRVENSLRASNGPQPSDETVQLRARTSYGDIVIHRSREAAQ
ncbi:MAG TPA: DUF4097 family beta strand repeat-containing protein [Candidatus Dormibacteraeota bacterium]|nr:DUF4097 family beta strand repeat-containing protein [Candidatus Dormibacteraeota bacterium]